MKVIRIVPNVSSEVFEATRDFYAAMFDLVVSVELDNWYLQLMPESDSRLNIGFVQPSHELFAGRTEFRGIYGVVLTIHVDDVDEPTSGRSDSVPRSQRRSATRTTASATSSWSTPTGSC